VTTFSRRYGYDPRLPSEPILEDAPIWLRIAYINGVLSDFTYVDRDSRYPNPEGKPLGIKALNEIISVQLRQEIDDAAYDSWYCWEYLTGLIKECQWYEFYDIVEIVGKQVKAAEDEWSVWPSDKEQVDRYGFEAYRRRVNELFIEERISWRLDADGLLKREIPSVLGRRMQAAQEELKDEFEPAREHYRKAVRYIYERPVDPENSIKEIVSALESVGRVLYPRTSTLGDVAKELRKAQAIPPLLVSVIEKFYGYASAEPAVRHGAPVPSRVLLNDAEFCLHLGIALIRYLIASSRGQDEQRRHIT